MIRRLNYTARRKIPRARVRIALHRDRDGVRSFDAALDLEGLGFDEDAAVYVEAYFRHLYMRFPFGHAGRLRQPDDRRLTELRGTELVQFRVKVVDESTDCGRILGIAGRIIPEDSDGDEGHPILFFNATDLGARVWSLRFDDEMPTLDLNSSIPDAKDRIVGDPVLFSLVMPSVVREILSRIVAFEGYDDADDGGEDWRGLWLRFVYGSLGVRAVPPGSDDGPLDEREEWVDEAVDAFCSKHRVLERYLGALERDGIA